MVSALLLLMAFVPLNVAYGSETHYSSLLTEYNNDDDNFDFSLNDDLFAAHTKTVAPTVSPAPLFQVSTLPSISPSFFPSNVPSSQPSKSPIPSSSPSIHPSGRLFISPSTSMIPSSKYNPLSHPSLLPSLYPSQVRTSIPTSSINLYPSQVPTSISATFPYKTPSPYKSPSPFISYGPTPISNVTAYAMGEKSNTNTTTSINQLTLIAILCFSLTIIGIGISYTLRHNQRRKAVKKMGLIACSLNYQHDPPWDYYGGGDEKCILDIEPKPINMAQDQAAYDRMLLRSRRNSEVILHANKRLQEERDAYSLSDDRLTRCVQFELNEHGRLNCNEYNLNQHQAFETQDTITCAQSLVNQLVEQSTECPDSSTVRCVKSYGRQVNTHISSKISNATCVKSLCARIEPSFESGPNDVSISQCARIEPSFESGPNDVSISLNERGNDIDLDTIESYAEENSCSYQSTSTHDNSVNLDRLEIGVSEEDPFRKESFMMDDDSYSFTTTSGDFSLKPLGYNQIPNYPPNFEKQGECSILPETPSALAILQTPQEACKKKVLSFFNIGTKEPSGRSNPEVQMLDDDEKSSFADLFGV